MKQAPFVPLYHPTSFVGLRSDVIGLEMNPLGISTLAMEKLRFEEPKSDGDAKRENEAKSAPEAKPGTSAPVAVAAAPTNGFVVQLAAFADDKGANALANKLKRANYAAYVEPVTTSRGTLWRVRVGGYASRTDADAARTKLKDEGYSGIVAPAK